MKTKNKRDDVIQAALEIIAENGFHNAPTSLIANRANVGVGTIYRYFKSKDELIHAIYSERIGFVKEYVLSDYDSSMSLKDRYIKLCRNYFDYMINNQVDYVFFEQYINSPFGLKEQSENILGFEQGERTEGYPLLQLFTEGQGSQVFKEMKLPLLVSLTMSHVFTLTKHWVSDTFNIEDKDIDQFFVASWDSVSR